MIREKFFFVVVYYLVVVVVTTLNRDIKRTQQHNTNFMLPSIKAELDLRDIRVKALNRKHWQRIVKMVTDAAYSDTIVYYNILFCSMGERAIIYMVDDRQDKTRLCSLSFVYAFLISSYWWS